MQYWCYVTLIKCCALIFSFPLTLWDFFRKFDGRFFRRQLITACIMFDFGVYCADCLPRMGFFFRSRLFEQLFWVNWIEWIGRSEFKCWCLLSSHPRHYCVSLQANCVIYTQNFNLLRQIIAQHTIKLKSIWIEWCNVAEKKNSKSLHSISNMKNMRGNNNKKTQRKITINQIINTRSYTLDMIFFFVFIFELNVEIMHSFIDAK